MHVCKFYVEGTCTFGKRCLRSHNILDEQPRGILIRYGIDTNNGPDSVLADLQTMNSRVDADDHTVTTVQAAPDSRRR